MRKPAALKKHLVICNENFYEFILNALEGLELLFEVHFTECLHGWHLRSQGI